MTDDRLAIAGLVHRYSDAVCRRDESQWTACWALDATWDLGRGVFSGRAAIVDTWVEAMGRYTMVIQNAMNGTATCEGDRGTGRWYIVEHVSAADTTPSMMLAYYDDEYVRVSGAGAGGEGDWAFASRRLTIMYRGPADLSGTFTPTGPT